MRLSILIMCFIELIILKNSYSFTCENAGCNTGFERCVCSVCNETKTVGIIYNGNCYFVELNRTSKSLPMQSKNTTDSIRTLYEVIQNREMPHNYLSYLAIIQSLTRHAYKALNLKQIAFNEKDAEKVFTVDIQNQCAVYQVRKDNFHIITDDQCVQMEKVFVDSEFNHGSAYSFSLAKYNHRQFDRTKYFSCFPSKSPIACAFLKHTSSKCKKIFTVKNRDTYAFMESFSLFKLKEDKIKYKAFLVYFDPNRYKVTKDDYYIDVIKESRHTRSSNTSLCYIADVIAGKLISQSSCQSAISSLKANYYQNLDSFTSMCRIPTQIFKEILKTREVKSTISTVAESEITHDNYTIVSESSNNETIAVFRNTSTFDVSHSTIHVLNLTIFPTNSVENVTKIVSTSNVKAESDYLDEIKIINLTLGCFIILIIILTCPKILFHVFKERIVI